MRVNLTDPGTPNPLGSPITLNLGPTELPLGGGGQGVFLAAITGIITFGGGVALEAGLEGLAAEGGEALAGEAYHYTFSQYASSIAENGLRPGSFATTTSELSPMQAQLDLALSPNRGLTDTMVTIDLNGLRGAGFDIPEASQVGRSFNMPGGGVEMRFPYSIPPEFLSVPR